jgi:Icc-related predicted phosphoesterase
MPRLVILSDTHGRHGRLEVPDGDILVHAGDLTNRGALGEVVGFDQFLSRLPHRHKIVIAGNHDFCFEQQPAAARSRLHHAAYLQDHGIERMGLRFYGSPWQPEFFDWAFNLPRGERLREVWARIPAGVDVLITHGPPRGVLDLTEDGRRVGCEELAIRVDEIKPAVHCFGHIHEAAGALEREDTLFINASICDLHYRVSYRPVVVDLEPGGKPVRVQDK